jgi:hypothetical protein
MTNTIKKLYQTLSKFNVAVARKLSNWLATMAMFYGVAFLVLLPLHWQTPKDVVGWAQYVVAVFFQGVALPVLAFVAKLEGEENRKLFMEIHNAVMGELRLIKDLCLKDGMSEEEIEKDCNTDLK